MQFLIVPSYLANRKSSTHTPKDPLVQFKDANIGNNGSIWSGNGNTTKGVSTTNTGIESLNHILSRAQKQDHLE